MAALSSSSGEKPAKNAKSAPSTADSRLRAIRIRRGLTQARLAELAGMHRNSIGKIEDGRTKEVTAENAAALASVLKVPESELGLRVRAAAEARSIRFRRLTPEQRQIVDELLSLPPEDYTLIRGAIEKLRRKQAKRRRGAR